MTRQIIGIAIGLLVVASAAFLGINHFHQPNLQLLAEQVEQQRRESDESVASYVPETIGRLDDLSLHPAGIAVGLPGVQKTEHLVGVDKPTHRIIHIRDWHLVPKQLFAMEASQRAGRTLSDREVDRLCEEHLLEVELVQLEQEALLRCLIQHHGLSRVLVEGLTPEGMDTYRAIIGSLRETDQELAGLIKNRQAVGGEAPDLDRELASLVRTHRHRLLEYGASGKLAMEGLLEVVPLDDAEALANAGPGKLNPATLQARHDAQVKAALKNGSNCSLLILGGSHDLSRSVRLWADNTTDYIRVTTGRYKEVSGE